MKDFEFKSVICTSVEQSKRLLELGLKKETADMSWFKRSTNADFECWTSSYTEWVEEILPIVGDYALEDIIPAWSLHRLMEMINLKIQFRLKEKTTVIYNISHLQPFQSFSGFGIDGKSYYNSIINAIEWLIKEGYFNKDYLEEKK